MANKHSNARNVFKDLHLSNYLNHKRVIISMIFLQFKKGGVKKRTLLKLILIKQDSYAGALQNAIRMITQTKSQLNN